MKYNYSTIKEFAKQAGTRVTDFIALAPQNDPFYVGTPTDIENAKWFQKVWQAAGYTQGIHLRRVHYWTVSQKPPVLMVNGLPYENTDKCWAYLADCSKKARYLKLVRIEDIVDNKNPKPHIHAEYNGGFTRPGFSIELPTLDDPEIYVHGIGNLAAQPYHLEVWCEKSTMDDVLIPVCKRYNANLSTFEGEVSITSCYQLLRRIDNSGGKPTRVWYVSDFDPAGNSMPVSMARKVEYMLQHFEREYDVRIKPLALTSSQVEEYQLPRIPIKETEQRAAKFEAAFGTGAVELDALEAIHPGTLGSLVEAELRTYYSQEAATETWEQERSLRQAISREVNAITARYSKEIDAVRALHEELDSISLDASEYAVGRYEPEVEEGDDWLFNSQRDYQLQIREYKAHKNCGKEEPGAAV